MAGTTEKKNRRGSNVKKGMRIGGRQKNTPNKRTTELAEKARIELENTKGAGKKLAKEVLEDFMHLFASIAATHQPLPPDYVRSKDDKRQPDEEKFQIYAKLTVDTAKALADFQSPKFRAIMVSAPADPGGDAPRLTHDGNVVTIDDPIAAARYYARVMKQGALG